MGLGTQAALPVARPRTGSHGSTQHRFYRASESDRPPWGGSAGTPHLGHGQARPTTAGPLGMVASLFSFRAPSRITTGGARAAARARWQTSGTTLPATNRSSGSGKNQPALDSAGSALPSPASSTMLHHVSVNAREKTPREMAVGGLVKVKAGTSVWTYRMKYPTVESNEEKISSKFVRRGLIELSTMSHGSTPRNEM
jgi:hypothetical protein